MSSNRFLPDLSKLEPFYGTNYKRWSQKILIFLEQLDIDYVLYKDITADEVLQSDTTEGSDTSKKDQGKYAGKEKIDDEVKAKFQKDNKITRGHILSYMSNPIFDLFISQKSSKIIWESLEKKYGAGKRKYVTGQWLNFQMVDDKPIMDHVRIYENLVADILAEGMKMCEILQANVMKQFGKDLMAFLRCRSEEVIRGGRMVLTLTGRKSIDPTSTSVDASLPWDLLAQSLLSLVAQGLIEEEKVDNFNVPFYAPCIEEVRQLVEKEASFSVNRFAAFEMEYEGSG